MAKQTEREKFLAWLNSAPQQIEERRKRREANRVPNKKGGRLSKRQKKRQRAMAEAKRREYEAPEGISYKDYMGSKWWKRKRAKKLRATNGRCERCGGKATQVHHKNYKRVGSERMTDLESVCKGCHSLHHEGLIAAESHLRSILGKGVRYE